MSTRSMSGHSLKWLAVLAVVAAGCGGGQSSVESFELKGVDESVGSSADAITTCVTAGSSLQTTTDLNLRSGPATTYGILLTMPGGAIAKEAGGGCPTSGWYKVTYSGVTGWASGSYLTLVTTSTSTRDTAIAKAKSGMGFSYWWGHLPVPADAAADGEGRGQQGVGGAQHQQQHGRRLAPLQHHQLQLRHQPVDDHLPGLPA